MRRVLGRFLVVLAVAWLPGAGVAAAQAGEACQITSRLFGERWQVRDSGFAGVDSCSTSLEIPGSLDITEVTLIKTASVDAARSELADRRRGDPVDLGDEGYRYVSAGLGDAHVISFRQGVWVGRIRNPADTQKPIDTAREILRQLPGSSEPASPGGPSGSSVDGSAGDDVDVGPLVAGATLVAGAAAVGAHTLRRRRRPKAPRDAPSLSQPPDCGQLEAMRPQLRAEGDALRQLAGRVAQARDALDQARTRRRRIVQEIARLSGKESHLGPSAGLSGGAATGATVAGAVMDTGKVGVSGAPPILGVASVGASAASYGGARVRQGTLADLGRARAQLDRADAIVQRREGAFSALESRWDAARAEWLRRAEDWNDRLGRGGCGGTPLDTTLRPRPTTSAPPPPAEPPPRLIPPDELFSYDCAGYAGELAALAEEIDRLRPQLEQLMQRRREVVTRLAALEHVEAVVADWVADTDRKVRLQRDQWAFEQEAGVFVNILAWAVGVAALPEMAIAAGLGGLAIGAMSTNAPDDTVELVLAHAKETLVAISTKRAQLAARRDALAQQFDTTSRRVRFERINLDRKRDRCGGFRPHEQPRPNPLPEPPSIPPELDPKGARLRPDPAEISRLLGGFGRGTPVKQLPSLLRTLEVW